MVAERAGGPTAARRRKRPWRSRGQVWKRGRRSRGWAARRPLQRHANRNRRSEVTPVRAQEQRPSEVSPASSAPPVSGCNIRSGTTTLLGGWLTTPDRLGSDTIERHRAVLGALSTSSAALAPRTTSGVRCTRHQRRRDRGRDHLDPRRGPQRVRHRANGAHGHRAGTTAAGAAAAGQAGRVGRKARRRRVPPVPPVARTSGRGGARRPRARGVEERVWEARNSGPRSLRGRSSGSHRLHGECAEARPSVIAVRRDAGQPLPLQGGLGIPPAKVGALRYGCRCSTPAAV